MKKVILQSILQTLVWTVIAGVAYPVLVTAIAWAAFPDQAQGSLAVRGADVVGSFLVAQPFSGDRYFWSRPSSGSYATVPSGASNLGPTSAALLANVQAAAKAFRSGNGLKDDASVPADMQTTSASGVDPHISPESAILQAERVARARGESADSVRKLVAAHVEGPQWAIFGEPRVNVLALNLALDRYLPGSAKP